MTKQKNQDAICYDLDVMTATEEQQFWYEFESMLCRSRDSTTPSLSRINIVTYQYLNSDTNDAMTLH